MKEELKEQPVAKVLKTFGTNGEVLIKISSDLQEREPLFIEIDELMVPFFIKSFKEKGDKAIITLIYMETENLAKELIGKTIYQKIVKGSDTENLVSMVSFTMVDEEIGVVGLVTDFYNYPSNPCLEVEYKNNKVLVPLNNKFIKKIDEKSKIIYTTLPLGILDIN